VTATELAAEDFMRAYPDVTVEVLAADYQSKPDIAQAIARDWFDRQGVDFISNVNNSSAALAIATLVRDKDKTAVFTTPASSELTGKSCGPNHVQWTYDAYALGSCTGKVLVAEGGDTWFFIAADYTFGKLLASDTARAVTSVGGKVLGQVSHPFPETTDFSNARRYAPRMNGKMPNMLQAGDYCAINHTLKAMQSMGLAQVRASGRALIARMKAMLIEDTVYGKGTIRADGRVMNPMYLFQVKTPEESRYPWDYYRLVRTVSADDAFRPLNQGGCPLVAG
jgi:branched-chain amino acid transport system substrate-binding protein